MNDYDNILKVDFDNYEKSRKHLLSSFNNSKGELCELSNNISDALELQKGLDSLKCDETLNNLDAVSFINISVFDEKENGNLFGEISDVIECAIEKETKEIDFNTNINKHATPEILISYDNQVYNDIINNKIMNFNNIDQKSKNIFITRCMNLYNETATTNNFTSDVTKNKIEENSKFIYTIGKNFIPNPAIPESGMSDAISYTIAVVSNLKDNSIPDINNFKNNITSTINNSLNNLIKSDNINASIQNFNITVNTLEGYKNELEKYDNPEAKNFIQAINAINHLCQEKIQSTEKLYNSYDEIEL